MMKNIHDNENISLMHHTAGNPERPAILFLHGAGLNHQEWTPQMEALQGDFFCIAPDLPEQGESAAIQPLTLEDTARRAAELIRQRVPSGRAHVVGLSLGGAVGLALARAYPEQVDKLIVSGSSAGLGRLLGWVSMSSAGMARWFGQERLLNMTYKQFNIPAAYHAAFRDDLLRSLDTAFVQHITQALMDLKLPARADLLVAVGAKETVVARRDARRLVGSIAGARGVQVPNVGHVWNLEAPELFSGMVRAFVTGQALPTPLQPLA